MWKLFARFILRLKEVLAEVGGWILTFMAFLIFTDVIARYFFNSPLPSVYEFSEQILMVSFVFLAISDAHHIDITLLVSRYKGRFKKLMAIARHLITLIFLCLVTWQSTRMAYISWNQDETSTALLSYPLYPGRITLIFGFTLLAIVELIRLVDAATVRENDK
jgi:TRAP-type C4-dicarboxylate transport system permease small subunit